MKVLAVSDKVLPQLYSEDVKATYPDVELLVGCGDLPFYYLSFLRESFEVPLLYVLGNHDKGPQYTSDGRELWQVHGGDNIHGRIAYERGLLFAGLEGSMRYRPHRPLMYTEGEMRQQVFRLIPRILWAQLRHGRRLDVLVTHSPPYQIHDQTDLAHTGFAIFLFLMRLIRPRFLLHGHIHLYHEQRQETRFEDTTIINVYPNYLLDIPSTI